MLFLQNCEIKKSVMKTETVKYKNQDRQILIHVRQKDVTIPSKWKGES